LWIRIITILLLTTGPIAPILTPFAELSIKLADWFLLS